MIGLVYAVSEPCGPWGGEPRMTPRTSSPRQDPAASRAIDAIIEAPGDWRSTTLARLRAVILSALTTATPVPVDDFWKSYQGDQGREPGGCSAGGAAAAMLAPLVLVALWFRRRHS